jgi:hypothetical protein
MNTIERKTMDDEVISSIDPAGLPAENTSYESANGSATDPLSVAQIPNLAAWAAPRAPDRDLWPAVAMRIRPARSPRRRRAPQWAAAASIVAVVAVVGVHTAANRYQAQAPQARGAFDVSSDAGIGSDRAIPSRPLQAPPALAAATLPSRSVMLVPAAWQPLHPETRALVRANLKIVSNAENQLQRALRQDPDDTYLRSLLATTRNQKEALRVALTDDDQ